MAEEGIPFLALAERIDAGLIENARIRRAFEAIKLCLRQRITPTEFRDKLELGGMAIQEPDSISVSGGAISGITLSSSILTGNIIEHAWIDANISVDYTINPMAANFFFLNPASDLTVTLPSGSSGRWIYIQNTSVSYTLQLAGGLSHLLTPRESVQALYTTTWRTIY